MYQPVIGMEVHVQVVTASKMFCACSSDYASPPPNTHACPICLGLPGVLPVLNRRAMGSVLSTGLALGLRSAALHQVGPQELSLPGLAQGVPGPQYDYSPRLRTVTWPGPRSA